MSDEEQQRAGTPRGSTPYQHSPPERVLVEYPSFADFVVSMGPTLSKLRLFVETEREVPLGTTVHTEIRLHERSVLIRAMGEVSGHEDHDRSGAAGIYVELRYLDPASAALIDAVLRHGPDVIPAAGDNDLEAGLLTDQAIEERVKAGDAAVSDAALRDEGATRSEAEVPESSELNLASWEDEVGTLVELALVDGSSRGTEPEQAQPPADSMAAGRLLQEEDPPERDDAELDAPEPSVANLDDADPPVPEMETSEDLEVEATDALALIAAQVMTDSDEGEEARSRDRQTLDDTQPVPESEAESQEGTQPVVEEPVVEEPGDSFSDVESVPGSEPSAGASKVAAEAAPAEDLELDTAHLATTFPEPQPASEDLPAVDTFSLDSVPENEQDLWSPDVSATELMFEEPSPSIEMYVSAFGGEPDSADSVAPESSDTLSGTGGAAEPLEETASEPALRPRVESETTTPLDPDERLLGVAKVKPLSSVAEAETSFAFGDDTAALIGGLDAWPGDSESAVVPPNDWPSDTSSVTNGGTDESTASPGEPAFQTLDQATPPPAFIDPPATLAAPPTSRPPTPAGLDSVAGQDDPLDQPPSEDTVRVKLGRATSFLDPEGQATAVSTTTVSKTTVSKTTVSATTVSKDAKADSFLLDAGMPVTVANEMARDRLNEIARGGRGGTGGTQQVRQRSWRPVLLLLFLVALVGLAMRFDLPALRWARERLAPTPVVLAGDPARSSVPPATVDPIEDDRSSMAQSPSEPPADSPVAVDGASEDVAAVGAGARAGRVESAVEDTGPGPSPAEATNTPPAVMPRAIETAVRKTVSAWQQGWSDQQPDAYLAAYAEDFVAANGSARSAWAAARRVRVRAPKRIRIGVDQLQVRVLGPERAEAWFFQTYETDETTRVTWKQLDLIPDASGRWLIQRETVRSGPPG